MAVSEYMNFDLFLFVSEVEAGLNQEVSHTQDLPRMQK